MSAMDPVFQMKDVMVMKGIAIISIVLHNFCHLLSISVGENEFTYSSSRILDFFRAFVKTPYYLPLHCFSFFGHYGVGVFVFLSGYGLAIKYEDNPVLTTIKGRIITIVKHYIKLLILFLTGYLLLVLAMREQLLSRTGFDKIFLWEMSLCTNIRFFTTQNPWTLLRPGVYWYFSLCFQLYLLYFICIQPFPKKLLLTIAIPVVLVAEILVYYLDPCSFDLLGYLRMNCVGWIPELILGVLLKYYVPEFLVKHNIILIIPSILLLIACEFSFPSWLIAPLFAILITYSLSAMLPNILVPVFERVGRISSALFIVHPSFRAILLDYFRNEKYYRGVLVYFLATIQFGAILNLFLVFVNRLLLPKKEERKEGDGPV